ncbi:MAG: hypothetical protein ACI8UO_004987 [Verrucomicrobiales bacterium]|jgi:hypothetical protein
MTRFVVILLFLSTSSIFAEPPEGFKALFNGKDLDGWHGDNPHTTVKAEDREASIAAQQEEFNAHWSVDKGELVNDGHGPYATTDKDYGDVEFHVEYKTVAKADSGIYLRGAPQVQIWDTTPEGGKTGEPRFAERGSGGLFNNQKGGKFPLEFADKPFGEWNSFRITQLGARTSIVLNDKLVVDNVPLENYWDKERLTSLPASGPIHLQTHGGEIRWRNVWVREIPTEEANAKLRGDDAEQGFTSIFNGKDFAGWTGDSDNYEVIDGAIGCIKGKGGNLFTEEIYGDFVVRLEIKLPPGGNNGLAIRYPGKGGPSSTGLCELQVIDNTAEKYKNLKPYQFYGSAYSQVPAQVGYLRPVGEWNYQEVTVQGNHIKVELNGSIILDTDLPKRAHITEGHFGFAGHNDPVQFRNIAIKKL